MDHRIQERIDVSSFCSGSGTINDRYQLTKDSFKEAIAKLSEKTRTLYLRTGYYECQNSIHLNFGEFLDDDQYKIYREGINIIGNYAHIMFAKNKSFHIEWVQPNQRIDLFYWEISGLIITGCTESALVRIGNPRIESNGDTQHKMAWNSCKFDMNVNNGYCVEEEAKINDETYVSPAVGIEMIHVLQSQIHIVATCKQGTAARLDCLQFCSQISGSFSNGQVGELHEGIYRNSRALLLRDCVSNTFGNINLEVVYNGIYFVDYTYGNSFCNIICNNGDQNGYVLEIFNPKFGDKITNSIQWLVIRTAIQSTQNNQAFPSKWDLEHAHNFEINHSIQG